MPFTQDLRNIFSRYTDMADPSTMDDDTPVETEFAGGVMWLKRGGHNEIHRRDGPAVIYQTGRKEWWIDGKRHRTDGPAIDDEYTKQWWQNGRLHRTDGPAFTEPDGYQSWYDDGVRHREDGPAVIRPDGSKSWYYHGAPFKTPEDWARAALKSKNKPADERSVHDFLRSILKRDLSQAL